MYLRLNSILFFESTGTTILFVHHSNSARRRKVRNPIVFKSLRSEPKDLNTSSSTEWAGLSILSEMSGLRNHFCKHLSTCRNDFVKERSVATNMVGFLQKIYQALDDNSNEHISALCTDFSKTFHTVPHFELMKKVADIWAGGCLLEVLANYRDKPKQVLRVDNVSSKTIDITSSVAQSFLVCRYGSAFLWMIFQLSSSLAILFSLRIMSNSWHTEVLRQNSIWPQTSCTMGERKQDSVVPK